MTIWRLEFTPGALKDLKKLPKHIAVLILKRVQQRLAAQEDPRLYSKALSQNFVGFWRLRVDDHRVVFRILPDQKVIQITRIAHRREVYE